MFGNRVVALGGAALLPALMARGAEVGRGAGMAERRAAGALRGSLRVA